MRWAFSLFILFTISACSNSKIAKFCSPETDLYFNHREKKYTIDYREDRERINSFVDTYKKDGTWFMREPFPFLDLRVSKNLSYTKKSRSFIFTVEKINRDKWRVDAIPIIKNGAIDPSFRIIYSNKRGIEEISDIESGKSGALVLCRGNIFFDDIF